MLDAGFQFRLFPLNFRLRSEACFRAFQIQFLLCVSASLRFLGFGLRVGVEQSGVALRFPPHSKIGLMRASVGVTQCTRVRLRTGG
jgi:hypothetical protein